jgi:hypothetical protein
MWCEREHTVLELRGTTCVRTRVNQTHVRHAYCDACAVYLITVENRIERGLPIPVQSMHRYNALKLIAPRAATLFGEVEELRA